MISVKMAASVDTDFDVPQLIVEVQNRPALYDTSILEYHDRSFKKRLWQEVCRELCTESVWDRLKANEQTKIEKEIQNRWFSLRGCFRREIRELNSQKKSLSGGAAKKKRKYIYFDSLLFLLPFTEVANNDSSVEADNNDEQTPKKENRTKGTLKKKLIKLRQKNKNADREMVKMVKEGVKMVKEGGGGGEGGQVTKKSDKGDDDDEAFLRSLLPSFKQFTQDQKLMLRIELIKTILSFKQSQSNLTKSLGTQQQDE